MWELAGVLKVTADEPSSNCGTVPMTLSTEHRDKGENNKQRHQAAMAVMAAHLATDGAARLVLRGRLKNALLLAVG